MEPCVRGCCHWDGYPDATHIGGGITAFMLMNLHGDVVLGRQATLSAADAPDPAGGDITLGYFDDDLPRSVSQGGTSTVFTLDSASRRLNATTMGGAGVSMLVRHYVDGSDNPAWTVATDAADRVTMSRYVHAIGGDLGASIGSDGAAALTLANLHGDVVTTVPITATAASGDAAAGIAGWSDYTEYGPPRDGSGTGTTGGAIGYGWLGAKQRATTGETAGLTLMGVRLYNPVTGRFTALDPVPGGNDTTYGYPNDPVNMLDLNGHWGWRNIRRFAAKHVKVIRAAAELAGGAVLVGVACGTLIGCAVAAGAAYGMVMHQVNDGIDYRQASASQIRSAGIRGALSGAASRLGAWGVSGRTATRWFGAARSVFSRYRPW